MLLLPVFAFAVYDSELFSVNDWRLGFFNTGIFATNVTADTLGQWRGHDYLFGAGPWFGCIAGSDTTVTAAYDPNSGGSGMFPTLTRYRADGSGNRKDRIYAWWRDWPPPADRFPMAPDAGISTLDLWCCYSDSDPNQTLWPRPPAGVDFVQTVYGYNYPLARDVVFLHYEIFNVGSTPLESCYFGLVADPDLGDATDDMTGLVLDRVFAVGPDTFAVRNAGFAFDSDNREFASEDTWTPGAVCFKMFYPATLSAFKRFTIDFDPRDDAQRYLAMAGFDYRTGAYAPFDSTDDAGADKRFLMAAGPFGLEPESLAEFWFAVIGSPYGTWGQAPPERDISDLALRCYWSDGIFDEVFAPIVGSHRPRLKPRPLIAPNPFTDYATVTLDLDEASDVDLVAVDVTGRIVRVLQRGVLEPGRHMVRWDGTADGGSKLSRGVYFIRLRIPGQELDLKTILAR